MVQPGSSPQINNNLPISITGLVLFPLVGLFALINAMKVNNLVAQGDYAGAQTAADQAKKLGKIAVIVGAVCYVLVCLGFCAVLIVAGSNTPPS